jgi:hypothetical protein
LTLVERGIELFHFLFSPVAARPRASHLAVGADGKHDDTEKKKRDEMKRLLKIFAAPAALTVLAFVAMATPAAAASPGNGIDYCRTDVTAGTRGCGYTSLEQCHEMSSGRGGDCSPNPFPSNAGSRAYAFQSRHPLSRSRAHHATKRAEH